MYVLLSVYECKDMYGVVVRRQVRYHVTFMSCLVT